MLTSKKLADEIRRGNEGQPDGIAIVPSPNLDDLAKSGEAAVSLRLGRWFVTMKTSNIPAINASYKVDPVPMQNIAKQYFVPFGGEFVLHPNRFVLASTLEWIRLPSVYAALVLGKSMLARRGIIIETAAGVHPGFSGCLTLEIANVGELPVNLIAGMMIGQLFVQGLDGAVNPSRTDLSGQRKPRLGVFKEDSVLSKLQRGRR